MTSAPVIRRAHPALDSERAGDTRARAWAFVFRCWQEKRKAAEPASKPDGRDDYERLLNKERRLA
jgi:hypothetical protein